MKTYRIVRVATYVRFVEAETLQDAYNIAYTDTEMSDMKLDGYEDEVMLFDNEQQALHLPKTFVV